MQTSSAGFLAGSKTVRSTICGYPGNAATPLLAAAEERKPAACRAGNRAEGVAVRLWCSGWVRYVKGVAGVFTKANEGNEDKRGKKDWEPRRGVGLNRGRHT